MIAIVVLVVASVESAPTKDDEEQSLNKVSKNSFSQ